MIEAKFMNDKRATVGTDFGNPNFKLLAESFGCKYFRVEKANDLGAVYEEAMNSKGIKIVDVPIDQQKNVALFGE